MVFGEKLFEEHSIITGFKVTRVHPTEELTIELSFTFKIGVQADFQLARI